MDMTVSEMIEEAGFEDVIIFEKPSYNAAFVGVSEDGRSVYDYDKMIIWLTQEEGMTYDEAVEFIDWNSSFYYGEGYPIILHNLTQ